MQKIIPINQGKPFYFIETIEVRTINRNKGGRGRIGTLLIMSYKPPMDMLLPCFLCKLFIQKEFATPDRYIKGKIFCLNCINLIKKEVGEDYQNIKLKIS